VLILGATGASGLIAVAAAKLLGAGRVIAAGRNPEALAKARRLGADEVVRLDPAADLAAALRDIGETAIDVVLDYVNGKPAEQALPAMATGGRMVQVGTMAAPGMHLHAQTARRASLDILGFAYYHAPLADQIAAYEQLCRHAMSGTIEIAVAVMPLSEIPAAWRRQKAGTGARIVVVPDGLLADSEP
jgi:NADPH:quinone reductase-like Zn-dependent oxidoreductase